MKIIEGMKQIKELLRKAEDLRKKIKDHCADLEPIESPVYGTVAEQTEKVTGWLQSHRDIMQEIARLRVAIQRTNLGTSTTIELAGVQVTKPISEWVLRRRDYAKLDLDCWKGLTDRGLKEGELRASQPGGEGVKVKIRRYYNPTERDKMLELFASEPSTIDARLEIVNAVTDLIE